MGAIEATAGLQSIEQALLGALQQAFHLDGVRVAAEPLPKEAAAPQADRECLVTWVQDTILPPQNLDRGRQILQRQFLIHLRAKSIHRHQELYQLLDKSLRAVAMLAVENSERGVIERIAPPVYDPETGFFSVEFEISFRTFLG